VISLGKDFSVRPSQSLLEETDKLLGPGSVKVVGEGNNRIRRLEQQKLFADESPETEAATACVEGEMEEVAD